MKNLYTKFLFIFIIFAFFPVITFAHQPRITESRFTQVPDPEISKAYYGKLSGEPDVYTIEASDVFDLYVGILVPNVENPKKDVRAEIKKGDEVLAILGGESAEWKKYFEPFGQSTYWDGGEYKTRAEAGSYSITVSSTNNDRKYSLAIGEIEAFDRTEGMNALNLIPELKRDFFEESPVSFIASPFGWGFIVVMYFLAGLFGLVYRLVFSNLKIILLKIRLSRNTLKPTRIEDIPKPKNKNLGKNDRLLRFLIGVGLLMLAITTTWSPILIFLSGFAMFEAIFSWCVFYAAIGKNTCSTD